MVGFVQWNRSMLIAYSNINPGAFTLGHLTDHDAYDAWLDAQVPSVTDDAGMEP